MSSKRDVRVKELYINAISSFIQGESNDFHTAMEEAETELEPLAFDDLKGLIELVPKEFTTHMDIILSLLLYIQNKNDCFRNIVEEIQRIEKSKPGTITVHGIWLKDD